MFLFLVIINTLNITKYQSQKAQEVQNTAKGPPLQLAYKIKDMANLLNFSFLNELYGSLYNYKDD